MIEGMKLCVNCGYPSMWRECVVCVEEMGWPPPFEIADLYRVLRGTHKSKHPIRWVFQGVVDNLRDVDLIKEGIVPEEFHADYRKGNPDWEQELNHPQMRATSKGYRVRAVPTKGWFNCSYCKGAFITYPDNPVKWRVITPHLGKLILLCEPHWHDFVLEHQPSR